MTVGGPVSAEALDLGDVLLDILALSLPKTKVIVSTRGQGLKNRVESESLNLAGVGVPQETNTFGGPDNDAVISTTRRPSLSVSAVRERINDILVRGLHIEDLTVLCIVHKDTITNGHKDLSAVRSVAHSPDGASVS